MSPPTSPSSPNRNSDLDPSSFQYDTPPPSGERKQPVLARHFRVLGKIITCSKFIINLGKSVNCLRSPSPPSTSTRYTSPCSSAQLRRRPVSTFSRLPSPLNIHLGEKQVHSN